MKIYKYFPSRGGCGGRKEPVLMDLNSITQLYVFRKYLEKYSNMKQVRYLYHWSYFGRETFDDGRNRLSNRILIPVQKIFFYKLKDEKIYEFPYSGE